MLEHLEAQISYILKVIQGGLKAIIRMQNFYFPDIFSSLGSHLMAVIHSFIHLFSIYGNPIICWAGARDA